MFKPFDIVLNAKSYDQFYMAKQYFYYFQSVILFVFAGLSGLYFYINQIQIAYVLCAFSILFIINTCIYRYSQKVLLVVCIFFSLFNSAGVFFIFFTNEVIIGLLIIAFGHTIAVRLHSVFLLAIHAFLTQVLLIVSVLTENLYLSPEVPEILIVWLLQTIIIISGFVFKLRKFPQIKRAVALEESCNMYESLSYVCDSFFRINSKKYINRISYECIGWNSEQVNANETFNCLSSFLYLLLLHTKNTIHVKCECEGILVYFSCENEEHIINRILDLPQNHQSLKTYTWPRNHFLSDFFSQASMLLTYTLLPGNVCFKITYTNNSLDSSGISYGLINQKLRTYALSNRELAVIEVILDGKSYKEAAGDLDISINTVKTVLRRVYKKCDVKSSVELCAKLYN